MNSYRKSDYAINKFSNGIVYRFANETIEITLEDCQKENPNLSEQDFEQLKILSDCIYYEQVKDENAQTKKNISLHSLENTDKFSTKPLEDTYIESKHEENIQQLLLSCLTPKQAKRLNLYAFEGLSSRKIAHLEGTHYRSVEDSLYLAKEKLKKHIKDL